MNLSATGEKQQFAAPELYFKCFKNILLIKNLSGSAKRYFLRIYPPLNIPNCTEAPTSFHVKRLNFLGACALNVPILNKIFPQDE